MRQVAEDYATQAFREGVDFAKKVAAQGGSSNGTGPLLKFSNEKRDFKMEDRTHYMFPKVLSAIYRGCDVYLSGEPGTGKWKLIRDIANALGREYHIDSYSRI